MPTYKPLLTLSTSSRILICIYILLVLYTSSSFDKIMSIKAVNVPDSTMVTEPWVLMAVDSVTETLPIVKAANVDEPSACKITGELEVAVSDYASAFTIPTRKGYRPMHMYWSFIVSRCSHRDEGIVVLAARLCCVDGNLWGPWSIVPLV
ncbi:hypothetical protein EJ06DRAFT_200116 [Trichodelitschia bisporula]|uniref:Uncharacterized protein n=1 Tax=Trichodelitschia bisporula TaxID=703511 RepID=A0A6G1I8R0_9PEZI|nr:hypothetical protein EJ06DRAFT_200116 [Trichodelitschia bisporula]